MELIKNVEKATPFSVADQVQYESGKVVSLTLAQQPASGMTLFAFDAGEAISTHAAGGEAEITIDGTPNRVTGGHAIILPCGVPHAVKAITQFKMLLTLIREA